jgi:hypothetical protein
MTDTPKSPSGDQKPNTPGNQQQSQTNPPPGEVAGPSFGVRDPIARWCCSCACRCSLHPILPLRFGRDIGTTYDDGKESAAELKALIMRKFRQHPEWHDIEDVGITCPAHYVSGQIGTRLTMSGPRSAPEGAFTFARELGAKFDLV